jgi:predicted nucleotidyltransferase
MIALVEKTAYGVDSRYLAAITGVCAAFPAVRKVFLYGSRARGDYRPESDIDLAVEAPGMTFDDFLLLRGRLDDLPLIFKVDALHLDALEDGPLKTAIRDEGVAIYERRTA